MDISRAWILCPIQRPILGEIDKLICVQSAKTDYINNKYTNEKVNTIGLIKMDRCLSCKHLLRASVEKCKGKHTYVDI